MADLELPETKQLQLAYWQALRDHLQTHGSKLRPQKPLPQHWTIFALGKSNEKFAEVVSGLAEGDEVARLVPGAEAEEQEGEP